MRGIFKKNLCPRCKFSNDLKDRYCSNCNFKLRQTGSIWLLILAFIFLEIGIYYANFPCPSTPVKFSIGKIDKEFSLSADDAKVAALSAAKNWNDASRQNLFEYDASSDLKINFVYDDKNPIFRVQQKLASLNKRLVDLDKRKADYFVQNDKLNKDWGAYRTDMDKYNADVNYWNKRGGMPEPYYSRSNITEKQLDATYNDLVSRQSGLNSVLSSLNSDYDLYNTDSSDYNRNYALSTDIHREGINKSGKSIDIYTYFDQNQLILIITHELGHTFTTTHAKNKDSIMYPEINKSNLSGKLTDEDISLISNFCHFENN